MWEDSVLGRVIGDTEGGTGICILFKGLEPCVSLCLLEDVVEKCLRDGLGSDGEVCDERSCRRNRTRSSS